LDDETGGGCALQLRSRVLQLVAAPISRALRWEDFSVRVDSIDQIPELKTILLAQDYERLASNLPSAHSAMWYDLSGAPGGGDMLPFVLVEMHLALAEAERWPLRERAEQLLGLPMGRAARDGPQGSSPMGKQYHGVRIITTNRSSTPGRSPARDDLMVMHCTPLSKNGHSLPILNLWDNSTLPTTGHVINDICHITFPRSGRPTLIRRLDPMPPSQVTRNASDMERRIREFHAQFPVPRKNKG